MTYPRRYSKRRPLPLETKEQNQISIEKGNRNEERFAESLGILIRQDEIFCFLKTRHFNDEDKKGIDFWVFTGPSRAIPFQVKSSESGREKHYANHGPRIRCVVVNPFITSETLAGKIKQEIEEVISEELAEAYRKKNTRGAGPAY